MLQKKGNLVIFYLLLLFISTYTIHGQEFNELTGFTIEGLKNGSVAWGDFDNDNDLDLLIIGFNGDNRQSCFIYENHGDETFTELPTPFTPAIINLSASYRITGKWNDIDNDGYLDVVLNAYSSFNTASLLIYQNNGDDTFTSQKEFAFMSFSSGSNFDIGDLDNDGDLDIVLLKKTESDIYLNQGNFEFLKLDDCIFPEIGEGDCDLGDYDNDGDLDIIICGTKPSNSTLLYKNTGDAQFELQDTLIFPSLSYGTTEWGDFNEDGLLDILMSGGGYIYVYKNNGDNSFSSINTAIYNGIYSGEASWGDIDNDGDLDISCCGSIVATCYYNNGDETFEHATGITLPELIQADLAPGDFDNDGDLDIALIGDDNSSVICKIFQNDTLPSNPIPDVPTNLSSEISGKDMILKWNPVTTDNTDTLSISYNIMLGSSSGSSDIIHPSSSADGILRYAGMGNAQTDTTFILRNLQKGTYYWKVQSVDNSFKGSAFSSESSFLYNSDCQAYGLSLNDIGGATASLSWMRGNGENCIVFAKKDASGDAFPINNTTYTASNEYGVGTEITGSGWFCIYKGTETTIQITGLDPFSSYTIQVFEYSGASGSEQYQTEISSNSTTITTGLFTELLNKGLSSAEGTRSQSFWVDVDNDEDLDIFILGGSKYLYRNEGNETFTSLPITSTFYRVADFGDFNNDGFIDLAMANSSEISFFANDGNGNFTQLGISLIGFNSGSLDWGDYDNDGDLDLLITGEEGGSFQTVTKLYKNNGDETFTEVTNHNIFSVRFGATDWADINSDGYLDIAISGISIEGSYKSKVYTNNKDGSFTEIYNIDTRGYVEWGDYDNDGDFDLLITSWYGNRLYQNDGTNSFYQVTGIDFGHSLYGIGKWGDYNNDGYLDIMSNGYLSGYVPYSAVLKNLKNGSFELDTACVLAPAGDASCAWGDFDNDDDLDILWVGKSEDSTFTKIYRNETIDPNSHPGIPLNPVTIVDRSMAILKWNTAEDDSTLSPALNYNLRVGTTSGGVEISSPHATSSGYKMIPDRGNASADTIFILDNLPFDDYYWSVQAVDQSFAGSPFSSEGTFSIVPVQATSLSAEIVSSSSLILRWEIGNGIRRLVFCKETQIDIAIPVDSVTYLPDSEFGFGEELGSTGWYCVYNGRGDSTIISGLNYNTNYSYQVIEYMGDIGSEVYFSNLVVGNPGIFSTGLFTEQTTITLDNADFNDFAWADYNNDGYTDLFIPSLASKLFKNNGDNTFSEDLNTNFPDYRYGSCAWGDYDNDGDLDIILTGATGSNPNYNPISSIYRNDGGGLFSEQSSIVIEPLYYSDVDWGDYNADGYLDILIMGASGDDSNVMPLTKVYLNNGDNSFTEHTESVLEGVCKGSAQWVDVDSDGDLDIHISGSNANDNYNESTNLIYKNNSGVFSYWATNLPPLRSSETDWGDYDHDGDLDVVMTRPGSVYAYENTGTSNFINILSDGYGYSSEGDVIWGDYDNDGYLDILFGNFGSAAIIYRNIESSGFEIYNDGSFKFTSVQEMNWCDYDNDGDIDMLVYPWGGVVTLYRNNLIMESGAFAVNTSAEAPTGIKSISSPTGLSLQWSPVQTDESPSNSLSYNISIGTSPDTANITPPHSDSTGFRLISGLGNASVDSSYSITNLETGKYYWQVQAVDMAFKGGQWSAIDSFEVKHLQPFFSFDTVCFESTSHFLDQSVATDEIISWTWDFGDGVYSTDQNPTHIFTNFGTHQVKLLVQTNEFSDSITQDVIVKPKPTTAFIADVVCQGTSTDFINSTTLNGTTITNWYWDFGDGAFSTLQDPPAHGYLVTGDYNVKLAAYADNGCADSIENTATVAEIPTSNIAAGGSPEFCEGESVKLSVFQSSSFNYQWKIGGVPVAGADSSVYYAIGTGDYTVSVTNQIGGCNSESATPVSVLVSATPPQPLIQTSTPTTFCAGDSVIISVTDNVDYSYQWKLNGGAVGSDTSIFVAKESGIYTLEVSNSTGCTSLSTNSIVVVVNPVPSTVSVSANGQTDFCDGGSVELSVPDDPLMDYQWMDGDISLGGETSSIYTATSTGNYKLVITNSDACFIQTQSKAVNVSPTPTVPTISTVGAETFCAGDSVILSVSDNPDLTYQWLLGGGSVGTDQNTYTANATGTYTLEVTNSSNCTSASVNSIAVTVNPVPAITTANTNGLTDFCDGGTVDLSVAYDALMTYQWFDGNITLDGATSNIYTADTTGNYRLVITNSDACFSETQSVVVNVSPTPTAPTINSSGAETFCEGETVELSVTDNPDLVYQWLQGGGDVGTDQNTFTADVTGTYNLEVTNSSNCSAVSTNTITVTVNPVPNIPTVNLSGVTGFCDGESVELSVTNDPAMTYKWMDGDITISGATANAYTATTTGNYKLVITNSDNCFSETQSVAVNVSPTPTAPTISTVGSETFCAGDSINFSVTDNPDLVYQWLQGGGSVGPDQNTFTANASGIYSLEVTNSSSCSKLSTNSITVTVHPTPDVPTLNLSGATTFCDDKVLTLSVSDPGDDSYQWMNELGTISGETASSIDINQTGNYKLRVRNSELCEVFSEEINVVVNSYPGLPVVLTENYGLDECQSDLPVILNIETPESGINYQWKRNGLDITDAIQNNYQGFLTEGEYSVEAENQNCFIESQSLTIRYGDMPDKPEILADGPTIWYLACSNDSATTYRWYLEGDQIASATDYLHVAGQQMGKYEVSISEGGCFIKSDPVWIPLGTSIEEDPFQNLKIYPNPTPGIFTIEMDNSIFGELITRIFSQNATEILNIKFNKTTHHFKAQVDLSGQGQGMYIITFVLDKYKAERKIVVE